jgi:hypothetical protein
MLLAIMRLSTISDSMLKSYTLKVIDQAEICHLLSERQTGYSALGHEVASQSLLASAQAR